MYGNSVNTYWIAQQPPQTETPKLDAFTGRWMPPDFTRYEQPMEAVHAPNYNDDMRDVPQEFAWQQTESLHAQGLVRSMQGLNSYQRIEILVAEGTWSAQTAGSLHAEMDATMPITQVPITQGINSYQQIEIDNLVADGTLSAQTVESLGH